MASAVKRLEFRCDEDQRELIDRAAALTGRSLTDFVLAAAQDAAMATIRNYETLKLNAKDSVAFAQALLNPPEPNAALRAAAERYKAATR
jgi:uncharacterized protein (DUF1778 family)